MLEGASIGGDLEMVTLFLRWKFRIDGFGLWKKVVVIFLKEDFLLLGHVYLSFELYHNLRIL